MDKECSYYSSYNYIVLTFDFLAPHKLHPAMEQKLPNTFFIFLCLLLLIINIIITLLTMIIIIGYTYIFLQKFLRIIITFMQKNLDVEINIKIDRS